MFVLEVIWREVSLPDLPTLLGPFADEAEAEHYAAINVTRGSVAIVRPLGQPYSTPNVKTT